MKKSKLYLLICSLIIVLSINFSLAIILAFIQTEYNEDLPSETSVSKLIGNDDNKLKTYYMNAENDLKATEEINELLLNKAVVKLSKMESYNFIFSVSKNDYVLVGKSVDSFENTNVSNSVIVYEKNNSVYIIAVSELSDNKDIFAVYESKDSVLVKNITKYKSPSTRYYVFYLPDWRCDLLSYNSNGRLIVSSMIIEYVIISFVLLRRTIRGRFETTEKVKF